MRLRDRHTAAHSLLIFLLRKRVCRRYAIVVRTRFDDFTEGGIWAFCASLLQTRA